MSCAVLPPRPDKVTLRRVSPVEFSCPICQGFFSLQVTPMNSQELSSSGNGVVRLIE
jgi:hypothetical protein